MPAAVAIPLIIGAASTGAAVYGANRSSSAAKAGAKFQSDQARYAAELEAAAAERALKFAEQQEATRAAEHKATEARNFGIYQEELARKEPFRKFALGAQRQLANPIYAPGSIGSMVRR